MPVEPIYVVLVILCVEGVPSPGIALRVEENQVMHTPMLLTALSGVAVGARPLPGNLGTELLWPEHGVHEQLQVMAGGGVAVEIDRAGGLEDAAQLDEARRHHYQVGHHGVRANELAEGPDHLLHSRGRGGVGDYLPLVDALRLLRPLPRVCERLDLRGRLLPGPLPKQDVVAGIRVERRVEVDEVHRLVGHVLSEDVEVIAVVEGVGHGGNMKGTILIIRALRGTSSTRQARGRRL